MREMRLLSEIVCSNDFEQRLRSEMIDIIPELKQQIGFDQNNPYHHLNLWEHTMEVIKGVPNYLFIGRLSALLHDIAKPTSNKYLEDKRKTVYYNHDVDGVVIAYDILNRLGFNDNTINKVCLSIALHRKIHDKKLNTYIRLDEEDILHHFIPMAISDVLAHKEPNQDAINDMREIYNNGFDCFDSIKRRTSVIIKENIVKEVVVQAPSKLAIFLIGEPRSGKSTVAELLKEDTVVLSADKIRKEVFNVIFDHTIEKEVWKEFEKQLMENIKLGNRITIDNTNISIRARKQYTHLLKSKGYSVSCINMNTSIPTLMRRCEETGFNKNICARFIVNKEYGTYNEFDQVFDIKE